MDEEAMWKGFYFKLQEMKNNPPTEREAQYVFELLTIFALLLYMQNEL